MNWKIGVCAFIFWYMETAYFGWNTRPSSDAELLADGISILILALSFLKPTITIEIAAKNVETEEE